MSHIPNITGTNHDKSRFRLFTAEACAFQMSTVLADTIGDGTLESQRIGMILTVVVFTLIALGAALGGWLLYYRKKKGAREGFAEPTKKIEIDKKEAKRGFFRPIIIVHIVVSVLLALMIVALALAYPYLT